MVSFVCDACQDTVKKPKLAQHYSRCHASFICVDCLTIFNGTSWKEHISCISEAQKVQGHLYNQKKKGGAATRTISKPGNLNKCVNTPSNSSPSDLSHIDPIKSSDPSEATKESKLKMSSNIDTKDNSDILLDVERTGAKSKKRTLEIEAKGVDTGPNSLSSSKKSKTLKNSESTGKSSLSLDHTNEKIYKLYKHLDTKKMIRHELKKAANKSTQYAELKKCILDQLNQKIQKDLTILIDHVISKHCIKQEDMIKSK